MVDMAMGRTGSSPLVGTAGPPACLWRQSTNLATDGGDLALHTATEEKIEVVVKVI